MKAIIYERYGSPEVLSMEEIEKPTPKADEVLIEVRATSVNAYDWHLMRADPCIVRTSGHGLLKPRHKILGADVAGVVEAVGNEVTEFKPGDEVFGDVTMRNTGGFAEYTCAVEHGLLKKPSGMSFEEAAAVHTAGLTAYQGLWTVGGIKAGEEVVVNGASGGVGSFAVQIAKSFGARVSAVARREKLDFVRSLGADELFDYQSEDFTRSDRRYDLIFDGAGTVTIAGCKRSLEPGGRCVVAGFSSLRRLFASTLLGPALLRGSGRSLTLLSLEPSRTELQLLTDLIVAGKVRPVIDQVYPLKDAAEAIRYIEEGRPRGKIVLTVP